MKRFEQRKQFYSAIQKDISSSIDRPQQLIINTRTTHIINPYKLGCKI